MKQAQHTKPTRKTWPVKILATAIIISLTAPIVQATPIGDLEIYTAGHSGMGTATITLMLNISRDMGEKSILEDYGRACSGGSYGERNSEPITAVTSYNNSKVIINDDDDNIKEKFEFTPKGCNIGGVNGGDKELDRLSRLKMALIELLSDELYIGKKVHPNKRVQNKISLPNNYKIGLGIYSEDGDDDDDDDESNKGVILLPARPLTPQHREDLIDEILDIDYEEAHRPTANAYAEVGAYMMGTTTEIEDDTLFVMAQRKIESRRFIYRSCLKVNSTPTSDSILGDSSYGCNLWGEWDRSEDNYKAIEGYSDEEDNDDETVRNYYGEYEDYSGFNDSEDDAKTNDEKNYKSPLDNGQCSGNGIYLITDGHPERSSNPRAQALMNRSLQGSSLSINQCNMAGGLTGKDYQAWGCMGEYAKLLRNPNNPGKSSIRTATVGFGSGFKGLGTKSITINGRPSNILDCDSNSGDSSVGLDVRNLCKLGERGGSYGGGGFYHVYEAQDIVNSITDFAANLVQVTSFAPTGTIAIPTDPYSGSNQLPYAYLPMLDPNITSQASIWTGNLKKYDLNQGTLFGKNGNRLYQNVAGDLNKNAQDLWQEVGQADNSDIKVGGVYAQLNAPNSLSGSVRSIYVEDYIDKNSKTPILRKLSVDASGKPQGFDGLMDTDTYTQLNKRRLLSFLGFTNIVKSNGQIESLLNVANAVDQNAQNVDSKMTLQRPTEENKVLGGVIHSKPTAVSYEAILDERGRIISGRDDYMLFGSMDGALHLVDNDDGKETFAIIPKLMLNAQPEALVLGSTKDGGMGQPYFGVDAPWLVTTDYNYDLTSNTKKVTVDESAGKGMFAYGGLRMGGSAFYGMNITKISDPKILFTITPEGLRSATSATSISTGFERMGQIWSKPTAAKIRLTADDSPTDVLIFGGGYDTSYESDTYIASAEQPAKGNAIYIVDAKSGKLIWSISKSHKNKEMFHSIVGGITVLDRDNDGLMDHLYAADLGGQVFRIDFENARPAKFGFNKVEKFSDKNVIHIFDASAKVDSRFRYRFYERPVVSFHRNQGGGANNGKIFALINVISGNRSSPLSKWPNSDSDSDSDSDAVTNRVYGIIDSDVTDNSVYTESTFSTNAKIKGLTEDKLVNLAFTLGSAPTRKQKQDATVELVVGTKQGWFYPLTRFDGYNNVRYSKGIGDSTIIDNLLYTTVYNPDKKYNIADSCTAKVIGGSERQLYCLPYGVCMDDSSITGTGGYVPAGQGIQELTLGAFNNDNTKLKVLIGTSTLSERISANNRTGYGADANKNNSNMSTVIYPTGTNPTQTSSDGSAAEYIFNERYTLQPVAWYEREQ